MFSININGVTRVRPAIDYDNSSGSAFNINTTNIANDKYIHTSILMFLPDYS